MRKLSTLILGIFLASTSLAQGYRVSFRTSSFDSGLVYLIYYMGKSLNIADSGYLNNGSVVFQKNNDTLPSGIYSIVFPGKRHTADFFIDRSPEISIQADTNDLLNMKVTGSPENPLFQQYQLFIANKGRLMQQEKNLYNVSTTKEDSALHEKNYTKINEELNEFRNKIIKENPQSMMTVLLKAMKDPEVLHKKPLTRQDSLENYYHYKAHFWDGVSFMDSRILRTPFFLPRLEQYYRNLLPQEPDSIIRDIDERMLYARNNLEMKKFMLNWLTDEYINPKYMGQDAVFIHLFNKYHNAGELPWLNEKQKETVSKRAYMQMAVKPRGFMICALIILWSFSGILLAVIAKKSFLTWIPCIRPVGKRRESEFTLFFLKTKNMRNGKGISFPMEISTSGHMYMRPRPWRRLL